MNMNTTKIAAIAFTVVVNAVLATAVVGLFGGEAANTAYTQVAKVEQITIVAKRA
jgi:hypothetical protein